MTTNTLIPILEMTAGTYRFCISRATEAKDLHALAADIRADDSLHSDEKESLLRSVNLRFSNLNAQTLGKQTPRWK